MNHAMHSQPPSPADPTAGEGLNRPGRRTFLAGVGAAGLSATAAAQLSLQGAEAAPRAGAPDPARNTVAVTLTVNEKPYALQLDPRTTLLDALRDHAGLTGTKKGCDHGQCGACTVHVNGRRVNACLSFAATHEGDAITTIEGLGEPGDLHPMQAAFVEHDGYQCGYCTAGQIMSAVALMQEPWGPADAEVREAMSGNICRCGAYKNIVAAIQDCRRKA